MIIITNNVILIVLLDMLKKREWGRAIKFFRYYSRGEHPERFKRLVYELFDYPEIIRFTGSYIFACFKPSVEYWRCSVIGIDDEGYFFVHNLDGNFVDIVFDVFDDSTIRKILGFTHHLSEVKFLRTGMSIRIQGDVVLDVLELFGDESRALLRLLIIFVESLVKRVYNAPNYKINDIPVELWIYGYEFFREWIRPLMRETFLQALKNNNTEVLNYLTDLTGYPYALLEQEHYIDLLVNSLLDNAWRAVASKEYRLKFLIGDHEIHVIGMARSTVHPRWLVPLEDNNTFIVLRKNTLIALHPEHKRRELSVPPGIYRIRTLNTRYPPEEQREPEEENRARIQLIIELRNVLAMRRRRAQ